MPEAIPLVNLEPMHRAIRDEIHEAASGVLDSYHFIHGPRVSAFERDLASYLGVSDVIGVSSGTDALLVIMMALGIGPGDEVITTPLTFFATAGSIVRLGATPVFADIDPQTYNLDPARVEEAISPRTRAILPVHLFGQPADMVRLREIATRHNVALIEDAAQAIGATLHGEHVGGLGDAAAFSFFPTKNLGAAGDGGAVTLQDPELAQRVRLMCRHGASPKYHHIEVGGNFRLDALQAAILGVKLPHLDVWNQEREDNARFYDEAFAGSSITTPQVLAGAKSVYHHYCVLVPRRDEVQRELSARGIGTGVYYPKSLHVQPCFEKLGGRPGDFPVTESVTASILALPVFPGLTEAQRARVAHETLEVVSAQDPRTR